MKSGQQEELYSWERNIVSTSSLEMGDLSEVELLRRRAIQPEGLENIQQAITNSQLTDNFRTRVLKSLLEFCQTVKTKLNLSSNTRMNMNGNSEAARQKIGAIFASMKAQTDRLFSSMENDAKEATESLNPQEQGAVARFVEGFSNIWEIVCDFVQLFFKILSKGLTWIYNTAKDSFLEFVDQLEAIVAPNQKQSISY
ncbi:hypothetical protein Ocin01_14897 [Orchesella cincta]|uniref:Uncharacterized protein n=1 Tax=Orchesella cincta TaxID=48709 RepID=A0A1D2MFY2_ORCCI|nr:hypothetical protein Ocin01_14897 [Orchesella cincta]